MLHIHNGDSSANIARQTSLPGEHLAWRESLITGPTPADVSVDEWRQLRAQHLSQSYGVDLQECERGLLDQQEELLSSLAHDEVVLWFEHDLFCQLHLLYLLNWFALRPLKNTRLSLICINQFPGKQNFRGLGELNPEEFSSLFPKRSEVTSKQLHLAEAAWRTYCSPAPADIEKLLQTETSALPFLEAAIRAHLQRFPGSANGLGRIENRALQLIEDGLTDFGALFSRFGDAEPIYGYGDAQFWLVLRRLNNARVPLLEIEGVRGDILEPLHADIVKTAKFKLTAAGKSVLNNAADFVDLNGIDLWLGGVHLSGTKDIWRWDEDSSRLIFK